MYIPRFVKTTAKTLLHYKKVLAKKEKLIFEPNIDSEVFFPTSKWEGKKNSTVYNQLVCIDGVGFCGSSAVGDYLGEYSNVSSYGGVDLRENPGRGIQNGYEVDFFRDPCSILDLERICNSGSVRMKNNAIHEFIKVVEKYHNSKIAIYDDYFYYICKKFVRDITNFVKYDSSDSICYISKKLTIPQYRKYANELLVSLLKNIPSKEYLVMDNLMSIMEPDINCLEDYFGEFKIIYVWCDPRDIYARARFLPGNDWVPVEPEIFVKWYKTILQNFLECKSNSVLCLNFDEFCNDYETVSKKIQDYLGLKEENHIDKFKYFDPKISINNTQVYKKLQNQDAIKYIYDNLREYCYISN